MTELYQEMTGDPTTGFRITGYFCDVPSDDFPEDVPYLGQPKEVVTYLQQHHIEQVYCCLPSARSHEILPIINYCENHLIRFYSVPNIRNYLHRRMHFEMFGNIPVLTIRENAGTNGKSPTERAFDLFFSSFFCVQYSPSSTSS